MGAFFDGGNADILALMAGPPAPGVGEGLGGEPGGGGGGGAREKKRGRPAAAPAAPKAKPVGDKLPLDRCNPALTLVDGIEWAILGLTGEAEPCWKHMREAFPEVYAVAMRTTVPYRTRRVFAMEEPPPGARSGAVPQHTKGVAVARTAPPARLRVCLDGEVAELLDLTHSHPDPDTGYLALRSYQDVPGNKGEREITLAAAHIFPTRAQAEAALDAWESHPQRASRGFWRVADFHERMAREKSVRVVKGLREGRPSDPLPKVLSKGGGGGGGGGGEPTRTGRGGGGGGWRGGAK
jgi:hypothetical protein